MKDRRKSINFYQHSAISVLVIFCMFSAIFIVDYYYLEGKFFEQYLVAPVLGIIDFLRSAFPENVEKSKSDFMLIGTALGIYVFLTFLFYIIIFRFTKKHDEFDQNYYNSQPKDKLVVSVMSLLFKNLLICLGLLVLFIFGLAFLANFIF
ncbi:hypothetical protein GF376_02590 [Candidatus Peregrinibacteria bacterium]|nr:hypothetical protein [Candidatus Peregrinibacteria bacterium]